MKTFTLIGFLALIGASVLHAQTFTDIDAKFGFRDIPLETPRDTLKILKTTFTDPELKIESVRLDRTDLTLNNLPLDYIACALFDGKVASISMARDIKSGEKLNTSRYISFISEMFGPASSVLEENGMTFRSWRGQKVLISSMEEHRADGAAAVSITVESIEWKKQEEAYRRKIRAEKRAKVSDGF